MNYIVWIVVGLIAGFLAGQVMRGGGYGLIGDIIVGIIGGLLGGWIGTTLLHINAGVNGINLESILVAFAGAVLLSWSFACSLVVEEVTGIDLRQ
jgi:uncharacterized membrane protein YeaQ/YmgE (transglycosylase-associated protein family)